MDHRKTFDECGLNETPLSVLNVCGMSADNAATMVENYRDENGNHTDAFIDAWVLSVSSVLANMNYYFSPEEAKEAREWFEVRGIDY